MPTKFSQWRLAAVSASRVKLPTCSSSAPVRLPTAPHAEQSAFSSAGISRGSWCRRSRPSTIARTRSLTPLLDRIHQAMSSATQTC